MTYFLEVYESWVPTEPFYEENQYPPSEGVVFGCSSGHPTAMVISLIEELKGITRILNGCMAMAISLSALCYMIFAECYLISSLCSLVSNGCSD